MQLKRVLVANRGEIAVRLIKTCKKLGITAVAIYVGEDADSLHIRLADEAYALQSEGSRGYLDIDVIISICKEHDIQAVIPGYGFLSENVDFANALQKAGILFIGPSPETLSEFGYKHRARELAIQANVPVVPGTEMISTFESADEAAAKLGYPIMVKATAGGGGMGLQVCHNASELKNAFEVVKSRGEALFKNAGMFLEKYVKTGRHIETQIFGNGKGDVLVFGERECSVQRRHQKVIEECPSPFVLHHPDLRQRLQAASSQLAAMVNYKSVGTVEFLVDDSTGDFYFLEMNTRLQVEHGVTELCFSIDLVEMMLLQAERELEGSVGLSKEEMDTFARQDPVGHAIEVRIYAENPATDFSPAPGLLQKVHLPSGQNVRVDTWVETGTVVSPAFDPLLAKLMVHASDRQNALQAMDQSLIETTLQGAPTNQDFLLQLVRSNDFETGNTTTNMLADRFTYKPVALEFLEPGTYTTVQDYPGRVGIPNGVPVSGPMDSFSFRAANLLVGNPEGTEGFEITLIGPVLKFYAPAVIALCGATFSMTINGKPAAIWKSHSIKKGSVLSIGQSSAGARGYLAIRGGLPGVAEYLGSKSTAPAVAWGGYQGRCMRAGDFLLLNSTASQQADALTPYEIPKALIPHFESQITVHALPGPWFDDEYVSPAGQAHLFSAEYQVTASSSRGSIRLEGPPPAWGRKSGGEGGSHPSNMVGFGCTLGGVSFTGDAGLIFTADAQNQTGYIVTHTVIQSDLWKLGQLRPGDSVQFKAVSWDQAIALEGELNDTLKQLRTHILSTTTDDTNGTHSPFNSGSVVSSAAEIGDGVLFRRADSAERPAMTIRQFGERALLCSYGSGTFDMLLRARVQQVANTIRNDPPLGFQQQCVAENFSLLANFDPSQTGQQRAVEAILRIDQSIPPLDSLKIPSRIIHLPAVFDAPECQESINRYMLLQRDKAAYLPDNVDFIRRSNGLPSKEDVKNAFFETPHLVNAVGWLMGLPLYIQVDPRKRLVVPKYNPSRTFTKAGSLGTGGNTSSIYPNDAPGGYMLWGMTLPGCCWDTYGRKPGFTPSKPWLFEPFDQIIFHSVSRREYEAAVHAFHAGLYTIRIEPSEFDMAAYGKLVASTAADVAAMQTVQEESTSRELRVEEEMHAQWQHAKAETDRAEKERKRSLATKSTTTISTTISTTKANPNSIPIPAMLTANVWKIPVTAGQQVDSGTVLAVLEAMKMEIAVRAPPVNGKYRVVEVCKEPGEGVQAGDVVVVVERVEG